MDIFDLSAKIRLDTSEFEKGVQSASGSMDGLSTKAVALGNAIYDIGKRAAEGFGTLVEEAVGGYADFEQLVGGVNKLFGEASGTLQEYAAAAYSTAGLSANDYMETVTGFAASLVNSLGGDTQTAADYADMAIRDMADNANTFGTSMSSLQATYQAFAKQNYSLLDNLKLGFGGTQQEMYRLLQTAQELEPSFDAVFSMDAKGHLTAEFADIVEAIHIVQADMEILGTTANEAASTVSGSVATMKAAWENWLVGLGDPNADMSALTDNLVTSVETAWDNLQPVLGRIGESIVQVFEEATGIDLSPMIDKFKEFGDSAKKSLDGLVSAFKEGGVNGLFEELTSRLDDLTGLDVSGFFGEIVDFFARIAEIYESGGISALFDTLLVNFENLTGIDLSPMIDKFKFAIESIGEFIRTVWEAIKPFVAFILTEIPQALSAMIDQAKVSFEGLVNALKNIFGVIGDLFSGLSDLIKGDTDSAIEHFKSAWDGVVSFFSGIVDNIKSVFGVLADWFKGIGSRMVEGLKSGFSGAVEAVSGVGESIKGGFKKLFGINSPSRVFADYGKYMAQGLENGWNGEIDSVVDSMSDALKVRGSVDFASSALGKSSSAQINTMLSGMSERGGNYNINLVVDGRTLANVVFDPLNAVSKQKGVAIGA